MIEQCSKKRLVSALVVLGGLTVVILLVENGISLNAEPREAHQTQIATGNITDETSCHEEHAVEVVETCRPCKLAEVNDSVCKATMYVEKIQCNIVGNELSITLLKSCPKVRWLEEKGFWTLECICALMGTLSYVMVGIRQKHLAHLLAEKVNKQIACGV